VASQESASNYHGLCLWENIAFPSQEKVTPALTGTLFPPKETKYPFYEWHTKSLVSIGFFSVFERFGKKVPAIS
jgi:hypothetical protein